MRFLCTKVKQLWLTSPQNVNKVTSLGLEIKESFIGISVSDDKPNAEQYNKISNAIEKLFGESKKAFPIRLIDL